MSEAECIYLLIIRKKDSLHSLRSVGMTIITAFWKTNCVIAVTFPKTAKNSGKLKAFRYFYYTFLYGIYSVIFMQFTYIVPFITKE